MKSVVLATAILFSAVGTPACAATLQYTLTGNDIDGTVEFARFRLASNPIPLPNNVGPGEGFRIKFIPGIFQYGSIVSNLQDVIFYSETVGGGAISLPPTFKPSDGFPPTIVNLTGPQLYAGPENAPTLLAGEFEVFDGFTGAPLSLSVTAVPEPATWGMMIAGFAGIGGALRGRRRIAWRHTAA